MSDTSINRFLAQGDDAAEAAFTPSPPTPASGPDPLQLFLNTEATPELKYWDGGSFTTIGGGGSGTVTNTGTLTDHAVIVGNGGADVSAIATGSAGQVLVSAGSGADPAMGTIVLTTAVTNAINVPQYVPTSSDESVANDTFQNDDVLLFAATTSAIYDVDLFLLFTSGTSNDVDVKIQFTLPASATFTWRFEGYDTAATAAQLMFIGGVLADAGSSPVPFGVLSTSTIPASPLLVRGLLTTAGSAGNFTLQWAQNVTTGGTPLLRKSKSFLKYTRIS